jgi:hypothetical protein
VAVSMSARSRAVRPWMRPRSARHLGSPRPRSPRTPSTVDAYIGAPNARMLARARGRNLRGARRRFDVRAQAEGMQDVLAARGLGQLPGIERRRSVNKFCLRRWIVSTGYERHFNTHARSLLGCAGTNRHLASTSALEHQHYFVNSEYTRRPVVKPSGSDGAGKPIAVLFIRP